MQKHIETSLGLKDIHKKIEHWATNHDFNETDSDIGKETMKVSLTKDYGSGVHFRWGLCIGLLFLGALFAVLGGKSGGSAEGSFFVMVFPLGYIAYYFYSKSGGMKSQVSVSASIKDGKTEVQIKSTSDADELKSDFIKLYNALAE